VCSCLLPSLSFQTSFVASVKLATGEPLGVYRSSGSLPKLPSKITLFTLPMFSPFAPDWHQSGPDFPIIKGPGEECNVRIVGGEFKRRRLKAPEGPKTRPTSDKVREALFDILGGRIDGSGFLDLYAGTGAVGLEALSRGARRAVFVEAGKKAAGVLRENLQALGLEGSGRVLILTAERALRVLREERFDLDLVFCDPPYADPFWPALLASFGEALPLRPGGLLVLEHAMRTPPAVPEGFELVKSYKYGDTGLAVMKKVTR
jgi:16S rRNA (guanine966-N2)-methyltransferase